MTDCGFCEDGLRQVVGKPVGVLEACPYCRGQGSVLPDESERSAPAQPPWTHVITGGPWPERMGLRCRIVADPGNGVYPWDKPKTTEAVVLVENDPHNKPSQFKSDEERGWTCVIGLDSLSAAGGGAGAKRPSSRPVAPSEGLSGVEAARSALEGGTE